VLEKSLQVRVRGQEERLASFCELFLSWEWRRGRKAQHKPASNEYRIGKTCAPPYTVLVGLGVSGAPSERTERTFGVFGLDVSGDLTADARR
jgi:hypothetical protein